MKKIVKWTVKKAVKFTLEVVKHALILGFFLGFSHNWDYKEGWHRSVEEVKVISKVVQKAAKDNMRNMWDLMNEAHKELRKQYYIAQEGK